MTEKKIQIRLKVPIEWRSIKQFPEYEGLNYSVSNYGDVRNDSKGNILKPGRDCKRYRFVVLFKDGTRNQKMVYDLVARAFIGEKPTGYQTDHIDRIRSHDYAWNLRYLTPADQARNRGSTLDKSCSSYIGVYRYSGWTWSACITLTNPKRSVQLGRFYSEEEAARAYDKALIDFGITDRQPNFPKE